MSVTSCKIAEPKLNKTGVAITDSQKFPILDNGHIVVMKGHMRNGGEAMAEVLRDSSWKGVH